MQLSTKDFEKLLSELRLCERVVVERMAPLVKHAKWLRSEHARLSTLLKRSQQTSMFKEGPVDHMMKVYLWCTAPDKNQGALRGYMRIHRIDSDELVKRVNRWAASNDYGLLTTPLGDLSKEDTN